MSLVKTVEEIEILQENALLVSRVLAEIAKLIEPGVTGLQLDKVAEEFIRDNGAVPAFLGYHDFPATLCISVNDIVIHGIPNEFPLQEGDIVSIDCGTYYKGYVGDSAYTFGVGEIDDEAKRLLQTTKYSLQYAAQQAIVGKRTGDIGYAVQTYVETKGYSVLREYQGHGIGKKMHEKPSIPNYGKQSSGTKLLKGMTFCIEPMVHQGLRHVYQEQDGWTIRTKDGKLAAHYEYTVVVGEDQVEVLTDFDIIETELRKKKSFF
ncbi:MAG: type I methionyl aminopeptidase [Bacteroidales bacterium]